MRVYCIVLLIPTDVAVPASVAPVMVRCRRRPQRRLAAIADVRPASTAAGPSRNMLTSKIRYDGYTHTPDVTFSKINFQPGQLMYWTYVPHEEFSFLCPALAEHTVFVVSVRNGSQLTEVPWDLRLAGHTSATHTFLVHLCTNFHPHSSITFQRFSDQTVLEWHFLIGGSLLITKCRHGNKKMSSYRRVFSCKRIS